jgi:hypothetical protein
MEAGMGSPWAWVFLLGTFELFGWGIWLGISAMRAPHGPHPTHGHRPGAPAAYDWRHTESLRDLYRVA